MANELQGAIRRLLDLFRSKTSEVSFSGSVSKAGYNFTPFVSGLISFASRLIRETPLYGLLTRKIEIWRTPTGKSFGANRLELSGLMTYLIGEASALLYAGVVVLAGITAGVIDRIRRAAGTISSTAVVSRLLEGLRSASGTLTTTGRSIRSNAIVTHLYDGAVDFSGIVNRGIYLTYTGVLDFAGTAVASAKAVSYSAAGALDAAGSFLRELVLERLRQGTLILDGVVSGSLTTNVTYHWVSIAGSISPASSLDGVRNLVEIILLGALTPIGRLSQLDIRLERFPDALLAIAGGISKKVVTTRTTLAAILTPSGILSRRTTLKRAGNGVLSFAGEVVSSMSGLWNYTASGVLTVSGIPAKLIELLRTNTGAITPTGILTRLIDAGRTITGALSFAGVVSGIFTSRDWYLGFLTFSGSATPYVITFRPKYSSTLTCTGSVTRILNVARATTGTETLIGALPARYKDILYYGPPNP